MLTLHVDGDRWHAHLQEVVRAHPGIVPVAKGNGYGLGLGRLAEIAQTLQLTAEGLGIDTLAVGTYAEVAEVGSAFSGDVLVLTPWRPSEDRGDYDPRVVHTLGRVSDLDALAATGSPDHRPRVVLELLTSMRRHGFTARELREAADHLDGLVVEGFALHLAEV